MQWKCRDTDRNNINGAVKSSRSNDDGEKDQNKMWDAQLPFPELPVSAAFVIVGLSAIICFCNSLEGDFVFDDSEAVLNNEDLRPETPLWNAFKNDFWGTRLTHNASHKSYRPLTVLSFRLNYFLDGGLKPWSFHMTNILLHAVASVMSLPVFHTLFGGQAPRAAFLCAELFAIHPIHTEAVAGVVGRADLLCAFFFFLSFLMYARAVNCFHTSAFRGASTLVLSMAFCAVSMFCKEQGITAIGICSAYDIIVTSRISPVNFLYSLKNLICSEQKKTLNFSKMSQSPSYGPQTKEVISQSNWLKAIILRHAVLFASGMLMLSIRWQIMGSAPPMFQKVDNPASFAEYYVTRMLSYNYIYALNAWIMLCPVWLCFDWSMGCVPLVASVFETRVFAIVAFWAVLIRLLQRSFLCRSGQDRRSLTMALAIVIIPFLPATNLFFRVGFVIAERVLYIPTGGMCMLVVLGLRQMTQYIKNEKIFQSLFISLVVIYIMRSIQRSGDWRTEKALFHTGLQVCPLNAKVHYNIAKNAADTGNRDLAVEEYRQALRLHTDYDQAMNNLANILKDIGELAEAEQLLECAVRLRPDFAAAWMNLGIVQSSLKKHLEGERSYLTALTHRKKYPDCYYNLGNLYLDQKRYDEAYAAWRNAATLKPTHTVAWSNMIIMLDSVGDLQKAESVAQEALELLPEEPSLHFNLANTLGKIGRYAESERHFLQAIQLNGNNPTYFTNLGVLYHRWKKYSMAEKYYKQALEMNPDLKSARENLDLLHRTLAKNAGQGGDLRGQ